ncbi:MAG: hypothetical protein R3344_02860 [Acidobacteriota bacterium]|nr:hypothetical protein [Acidobacteriota bacterium]
MSRIYGTPNANGGIKWDVDDGNGRRAATFGNSMEINEEFQGAGFVLEVKTNGTWQAVNDWEAQTFDGGKLIRGIKAELLLGQGLRWKVDGAEVTKTCSGCNDLPAEFDTPGDSSKLLDDNGNEATEGKGDKTSV